MMQRGGSHRRAGKPVTVQQVNDAFGPLPKEMKNIFSIRRT
jgi:hypothetical protein